MDYLYEYLVFLGQAATILVLILIFIGVQASKKNNGPEGATGKLRIKMLNESLAGFKKSLQEVILDGQELKVQRKKDKGLLKSKKKQVSSKDLSSLDLKKPRIYVLEFYGDVQASGVARLATEITAVLTMARSQDEVVVCVESGGGLVHGYGLAASQLERIKSKGIRLTVAVDKVAASGGYLMAAVANSILAAPFAVVGSIGVVAQIPNIHRWLKNHDIDVELLTSGKYKRTLTIFGENDDEGRDKLLNDLEDTHGLFKNFVSEHRPMVDLDRVSTGETWYGQQAIDLNLVDRLITSDQYLSDACETADVYKITWVEHKPRVLDRLLSRVASSVNKVLSKI